MYFQGALVMGRKTNQLDINLFKLQDWKDSFYHILASPPQTFFYLHYYSAYGQQYNSADIL
jgi:hypothetical protein